MALTRKDIKEGLKSMPIIETIAKEANLTAKQKAFAENLAHGETKAGAYRKAYNSKGKPSTQSIEGQRLARNPIISHHVEAIKVAIEAQKYLFPAHLKALVQNRLVEKSLDPDVPHAVQVKALEIISKWHALGLHDPEPTAMKDINSHEVKDRLVKALTSALNNNKGKGTEKNVNDLLNEITGKISNQPEPITIDHNPYEDDQSENPDDPILQNTVANSQNPETETPTEADPPFLNETGETDIHTISHKRQSIPNEVPTLDVPDEEGEGVSEILKTELGINIENIPLDDLDQR